MTLGSFLDKCWELVLDGIFPRRCPLCGGIAVPVGGYVCADCHERRQRITEPRCGKCGKSLASSGELFCTDCEESDFAYDRARAIWSYDKQMRRSIQQFKYKGRQEYADYYGSQLIAVYGSWISQINPDVILPVPIHGSRRRKRGFNQAELLAERVSLAMNIPLLTDYLVRPQATIALKDLGRQDRRESLKKAFAINRRSLGWKYQLTRVLLIDDIYTTGATVDACARVLKENGTREVYVLCLCIGSS